MNANVTYVEIKDEAKHATYVTRYYIRTVENGTEEIWSLSYMIKNGEETVLQNMFIYDTSRRPELDTPEKIHAKLVDMLHKMEESALADIDPDDSVKRTVTFFDHTLMEEAEILGAHLDTEWAEEHAALYESFQNKLDSEYNAGRLTAAEYNEIGCVAFFDFDVKGEEE